jgi:hypothetical protein
MVFTSSASKLSRFAPGSKTGMTWNRCSLPQIPAIDRQTHFFDLPWP